MESQQVVLWQAESADWDFIIDAGVRPVPIVAVQPERASRPGAVRLRLRRRRGPHFHRRPAQGPCRQAGDQARLFGIVTVRSLVRAPAKPMAALWLRSGCTLAAL